MDRVKLLGMAAKEFAHEHRDCFVIIADAKTDHILAAYNDSHIYAQIKSTTGSKTQVVKEVLRHSKFAKSLNGFPRFKLAADMFIGELASTLHLHLHRAREFYKFVSDALWYLPKRRTPGDKS